MWKNSISSFILIIIILTFITNVTNSESFNGPPEAEIKIKCNPDSSGSCTTNYRNDTSKGDKNNYEQHSHHVAHSQEVKHGKNGEVTTVHKTVTHRKVFQKSSNGLNGGTITTFESPSVQTFSRQDQTINSGNASKGRQLSQINHSSSSSSSSFSSSSSSSSSSSHSRQSSVNSQKTHHSTIESPSVQTFSGQGSSAFVENGKQYQAQQTMRSGNVSKGSQLSQGSHSSYGSSSSSSSSSSRQSSVSSQKSHNSNSFSEHNGKINSSSNLSGGIFVKIQNNQELTSGNSIMYRNTTGCRRMEYIQDGGYEYYIKQITYIRNIRNSRVRSSGSGCQNRQRSQHRLQNQHNSISGSHYSSTSSKSQHNYGNQYRSSGSQMSIIHSELSITYRNTTSCRRMDYNQDEGYMFYVKHISYIRTWRKNRTTQSFSNSQSSTSGQQRSSNRYSGSGRQQSTSNRYISKGGQHRSGGSSSSRSSSSSIGGSGSIGGSSSSSSSSSSSRKSSTSRGQMSSIGTELLKTYRNTTSCRRLRYVQDQGYQYYVEHITYIRTWRKNKYQHTRHISDTKSEHSHTAADNSQQRGQDNKMAGSENTVFEEEDINREVQSDNNADDRKAIYTGKESSEQEQHNQISHASTLEEQQVINEEQSAKNEDNHKEIYTGELNVGQLDESQFSDLSNSNNGNLSTSDTNQESISHFDNNDENENSENHLSVDFDQDTSPQHSDISNSNNEKLSNETNQENISHFDNKHLSSEHKHEKYPQQQTSYENENSENHQSDQDTSPQLSDLPNSNNEELSDEKNEEIISQFDNEDVSSENKHKKYPQEKTETENDFDQENSYVNEPIDKPEVSHTNRYTQTSSHKGRKYIKKKTSSVSENHDHYHKTVLNHDGYHKYENHKNIYTNPSTKRGHSNSRKIRKPMGSNVFKAISTSSSKHVVGHRKLNEFDTNDNSVQGEVIEKIVLVKRRRHSNQIKPLDKVTQRVVSTNIIPENVDIHLMPVTTKIFVNGTKIKTYQKINKYNVITYEQIIERIDSQSVSNLNKRLRGKRIKWHNTTEIDEDGTSIHTWTVSITGGSEVSYVEVTEAHKNDQYKDITEELEDGSIKNVWHDRQDDGTIIIYEEITKVQMKKDRYALRNDLTILPDGTQKHTWEEEQRDGSTILYVQLLSKQDCKKLRDQNRIRKIKRGRPLLNKKQKLKHGSTKRTWEELHDGGYIVSCSQISHKKEAQIEEEISLKLIDKVIKLSDGTKRHIWQTRANGRIETHEEVDTYYKSTLKNKIVNMGKGTQKRIWEVIQKDGSIAHYEQIFRKKECQRIRKRYQRNQPLKNIVQKMKGGWEKRIINKRNSDGSVTTCTELYKMKQMIIKNLRDDTFTLDDGSIKHIWESRNKDGSITLHTEIIRTTIEYIVHVPKRLNDDFYIRKDGSREHVYQEHNSKGNQVTVLEETHNDYYDENEFGTEHVHPLNSKDLLDEKVNCQNGTTIHTYQKMVNGEILTYIEYETLKMKQVPQHREFLDEWSESNGRKTHKWEEESNGEIVEYQEMIPQELTSHSAIYPNGTVVKTYQIQESNGAITTHTETFRSKHAIHQPSARSKLANIWKIDDSGNVKHYYQERQFDGHVISYEDIEHIDTLTTTMRPLINETRDLGNGTIVHVFEEKLNNGTILKHTEYEDTFEEYVDIDPTYVDMAKL